MSVFKGLTRIASEASCPGHGQSVYLVRSVVKRSDRSRVVLEGVNSGCHEGGLPGPTAALLRNAMVGILRMWVSSLGLPSELAR